MEHHLTKDEISTSYLNNAISVRVRRAFPLLQGSISTSRSPI